MEGLAVTMEENGNLLENLNIEQQQAVTATEGFVRVVAGAGTGKTRTLCHRYAYLVETLGISPANILCLTFTNKAAAEMKKRIKSLLGGEYETSLISTVHSFCVRVLREDIFRLFWAENFIVLDIPDRKKILEEIYEELSLRLDNATFSSILDKIDGYKNDLEYLDIICDPSADILNVAPKTQIELIATRYISKQKKHFGLDFADLINFTLYLFTTHAEVCEKWKERLHYIMVDEFQDITSKENRLINILTALHGNLFVVGDPDQNIYEWRGSKMHIIMDFDKKNTPCQSIVLSQNYRSFSPILAAANSLIDKNVNRIKKDLYTKKEGGALPLHFHAATEKDEGVFIADKIKELIANGEPAGEIAIMYRASFISRFVEQALLKENLSYVVWGGVGFYERMEVKDVLAYLRLVSHGDDLSFERIVNIPRRKIGKAKIDYIKSYAKKEDKSLYETLKNHCQDSIFKGSGAKKFIETIEGIRELQSKLTISDLLQRLLFETGYDEYIRVSGDIERLDNISEFISSIVNAEREYGEDLPLDIFLQNISLIKDSDSENEVHEKIKLMTVHTAKGLEFKNVFVVGVNDGVFPSSRSLEERPDALEEERRLFFVAMTRAKERLFITENEGFEDRGQIKSPSRFIGEIGDGLIERAGLKLRKAPQYFQPKAQSEETEAVFVIGDRIGHTYFGEGVIESINEKNKTYNILFGDKIKPISFSFKGISLVKPKKSEVNGWVIE